MTMGKKEMDNPSKTQKLLPTQEQPPATYAAYPDWTSFQAYYSSASTPGIPPGYFHYPVAPTPQTPPFIWASQIIHPYGTPPSPYVAVYPPMGLYPHPSTPATAIANGVEMDGNSVEDKEKCPIKRSKGSLGSLNMHIGKGDKNDEGSAISANGALSQSGESGSELSTEGSDANSDNDSQQKQNVSGAEAAQNEETAGNMTSEATQALKAQTLNYVMPLAVVAPDGVSAPRTSLVAQGNVPSAAAATMPSGLSGSHTIVPTDPLIQDERELKRQRRKQANRESARRSRLRKLAESEELAQCLISLTQENDSLKKEFAHVKEDCEKLAAENASLNSWQEKLQKHKNEEHRVDDDKNLEQINKLKSIT